MVFTLTVTKTEREKDSASQSLACSLQDLPRADAADVDAGSGWLDYYRSLWARKECSEQRARDAKIDARSTEPLLGAIEGQFRQVWGRTDFSWQLVPLDKCP